MLGKTVTDEELTTANTANKKWLEDNHFPTTTRKDFQVDKISDELLLIFLKMKQDHPDQFEVQAKMWHHVNIDQFNAYEASLKAPHMKKEIVPKPPPAKLIDVNSTTLNDNVDSEKVHDDENSQESATVGKEDYAPQVTKDIMSTSAERKRTISNNNVQKKKAKVRKKNKKLKPIVSTRTGNRSSSNPSAS